jgi:hypothetical protein
VASVSPTLAAVPTEATNGTSGAGEVAGDWGAADAR